MVPNQKEIVIEKEEANKKNPYAIFNLQALAKASSSLTTKAGFKLFIYMAQNQKGWRFALSSSHFCSWANCGISAYNSAIEELLLKGYLVPTQKKNCFVFKEGGVQEQEKAEEAKFLF